MNWGLIHKSVRETWVAALLIGLAMLAFKTLLAFVIPQFAGEMGAAVFQLAFVRNMISALLGAEIGDAFSASLMSSFAWVHPVVLALIWAQGITFCTRVPAGEVDRGTIDVLLGLPVSRWSLYRCESLVWLVWGLVIIALGWVGGFLGGLVTGPEFRPAPTQVLIIVVNLYCVYVAVGGLAWLVSALSDRRGKAVAVVFAIVLGSFALGFLAQFWEPARSVSFLSVLNYYRPLHVLQSSKWPWEDMLVLVSAGGLFWVTGGLIFARRDIRTV